MPTTMPTIASERDIADFFSLHDQRQQRRHERSTLQAQQAVAACTVLLFSDDSGVVEVYEDDDNGDDNVDAYGYHHQGHGKSRLNPTATASNYPRGRAACKELPILTGQYATGLQA